MQDFQVINRAHFLLALLLAAGVLVMWMMWGGNASASLAASTLPMSKPEQELVRLVRQDCGSCHGLTLKGGLGKPLLPENLAGRDAETLAEIILDGIPGTPMPPWRAILQRNDALWIARKLKEGFPDASP